MAPLLKPNYAWILIVMTCSASCGTRVQAQNTDTAGVRVVSYNIRHGFGTDDRLDLGRTAKKLAALQADVIGIQEVDKGAARSGGVDQPAFLAEQLKMESAFGAFMDFDGGEYGLAILSRFPITHREVVRLPDGNEPRVALVCQVSPPGQPPFLVVNIHLDWVKDDGFRFAQAQRVAAVLAARKLPWILLGDFNDQPGSRTLHLLSRHALPATKPAEDRMTFSSTDPTIEIDFLFAAPADRWRVTSCQVMDAPRTSDHRPVLAVFQRIASIPPSRQEKPGGSNGKRPLPDGSR